MRTKTHHLPNVIHGMEIEMVNFYSYPLDTAPWETFKSFSKSDIFEVRINAQTELSHSLSFIVRYNYVSVNCYDLDGRSKHILLKGNSIKKIS